MNIVIFYYPHNRLLRKDGTYFTAQANSAREYYEAGGHTVLMFPIPKANNAVKLAAFERDIKSLGEFKFNRLLFFCHGTENWCDAGLTVSTVPRVAALLKAAAVSDEVAGALVRVGFFCCLCAKKVPGGLAYELFSSTGFCVLGHTTSGDTVFNPNKRFFWGRIDGVTTGRFDNLAPAASAYRGNLTLLQWWRSPERVKWKADLLQWKNHVRLKWTSFQILDCYVPHMLPLVEEMEKK